MATDPEHDGHRPKRNLAGDTVAGGQAADGKPADQAGTRHLFQRVTVGALAPPDAHSCR
jgi:hypothetical protein